MTNRTCPVGNAGRNSGLHAESHRDRQLRKCSEPLKHRRLFNLGQEFSCTSPKDLKSSLRTKTFQNSNERSRIVGGSAGVAGSVVRVVKILRNGSSPAETYERRTSMRARRTASEPSSLGRHRRIPRFSLFPDFFALDSYICF